MARYRSRMNKTSGPAAHFRAASFVPFLVAIQSISYYSTNSVGVDAASFPAVDEQRRALKRDKDKNKQNSNDNADSLWTGDVIGGVPSPSLTQSEFLSGPKPSEIDLSNDFGGWLPTTQSPIDASQSSASLEWVGAPPTDLPSQNPTPPLTVSPSAISVDPPTLSPTVKPTPDPTHSPTVSPSKSSSPKPTEDPSQSPTKEPTESPTGSPTGSPTESPNELPTSNPSSDPSKVPTPIPTYLRTHKPTRKSSNSPTASPSTESPTTNPTLPPSTASPSKVPFKAPTQKPTTDPTDILTKAPSSSPTLKPTGFPSTEPTASPIGEPTDDPSQVPSRSPTLKPTRFPSTNPIALSLTDVPTQEPSLSPSLFKPTEYPTFFLTTSPSQAPSKLTAEPTKSSPVSIGGIVWNDENENGLFDSSEEGFGNVSIHALTCENKKTVAIGSSKRNGSFLLKNIGPAGCYYLTFMSIGDQYSFTTPDVDISGRTADIILSSGETKISVNAGIVFAKLPTSEPTAQPSLLPTESPTKKNTSEPTGAPSISPTSTPTKLPTSKPSAVPSSLPSTSPPSANPISKPTESPSTVPTVNSSLSPTNDPIGSPTTNPSQEMSIAQIKATLSPSISPSFVPTIKIVKPMNPTSLPSLATNSPVKRVTTFRSVAPSILASMKPSESLTSAPFSKPTMVPSVQLTRASVTLIPSSSPTSALTHSSSQRPTKKTTHEPTVPQSLLPSMNILSEEQTPSPTTVIASNNTSYQELPTSVAGIPMLQYVLLETPVVVSQDAIEAASSAINTFLNARLSHYYNADFDHFSSLKFSVAEGKPVLRQFNETKKTEEEGEPIRRLRQIPRRQQAQQLSGTQLIFDGEIEFYKEVPSATELEDVFMAISEEHNKELVSNIINTNHPELSGVFIVFVEQQSDSSQSSTMHSSVPSASPTLWTENFVPTVKESSANGIKSSARLAEDDGVNTPLIIISITGVAALTMLIFVLATRRVPRRDIQNERIVDQERRPQRVVQTESHVDSPENNFDQNQTSGDADISFDHDNDVGTAISSVTDWNDYHFSATKVHNRGNSPFMGIRDSTKASSWESSERRDMANNCQGSIDSRSSERNSNSLVEIIQNFSVNHDSAIETWWSPSHGDRQATAAELNSRGTMSLEKNDHSVLPRSWLNAMHGEQSSVDSHTQGAKPRFSLGAVSISSSEMSQNSEAGDNSSCVSKNNGSFPRHHSTDGSFPNVSTPKINASVSNDFMNTGVQYQECILNGGNSDSLVDISVRSEGIAVADQLDWSHIGTVKESESESDSESSYSAQSAPEIKKTSSQESQSTGSSLNQFISDLVWLEQKISKDKETVGLDLKVCSIEQCDSLSYECDAFSPRSLSDNSSNSNSQTMSIACRDCYIPPGDVGIEVISTKDGPMIKYIKKGRSVEGHLNTGDLIIAVDDKDTRSLSADQVMTSLSSRSECERKITVLQFGEAEVVL